MKRMIKTLAVGSMVLLSGCATGQASFTDQLRDTMLFTSASDVPASKVKCITLTKPFIYETRTLTGTLSYTLPAGTYKGLKKNSTGYFYYSPSKIPSTSWVYNRPLGIYINNQFKRADLFSYGSSQIYDEPIRSFVLPNTIFSDIKKNGSCK